MTTISCIAHRGASGVAPENTMLALWTAYQSNADLIEFDVQITKDAQLVLFHDITLERITGDTSRISDNTLSELQNKDFGIWKGSQFAKLCITTLHHVLSNMPKRASFILEVKPQNIDLEKNFNLERLILDELDNSGRDLGNGYISIRAESSAEWLKSQTSKYDVGLMQKKRTPEEYYEIIKTQRIKFAQIRRNHTTAQIQKLKDLGSKVMMFYADTPEDWNKLIADGVDGILTNYPELLSGYLKMRNL